MEACVAVEREIDKVLSKFGGISDHAERVMRDICSHIENLKKELEECKLLTIGSYRFLKTNITYSRRYN